MGPETLARLVDDHAAALVLYARQWCSAPEDVVQEAFIKLVRQSKPPANPLPWLYRVVRNGALTALRSDRRRRRHETVAATRNSGWFFPTEAPGLDGARAAAALEVLPIEQREVIVARLWGGLTFEQIAELASVSSSSVHRWYVAGLASLRERLDASCPTKPSTHS
jgi:DNA-directed RNA polymerase specialized sigma24 family protein